MSEHRPSSEEPNVVHAAAAEIPIEERVYARNTHLMGMFFSFFGPGFIWLRVKDEPGKSFLKGQVKEALNFQITLAIGYVISLLLLVVLIGGIMLIILMLMSLIFGVKAVIAAEKGQNYRYPFALRLIK